MERVGKPEGNDGWAVVEALTQGSGERMVWLQKYLCS